LEDEKSVSAVLANASPRRIKATHRRRRKVTAGHFVQRYYDPLIGRFLSVDPMASDMNNGWNFNRYNYAANNPYKFTDPDGRQSFGYGTNQPAGGIKSCKEANNCVSLAKAEQNFKSDSKFFVKVQAATAVAGGGAAALSATGATAAAASTVRTVVAATDAKVTTIGIAVYVKGAEVASRVSGQASTAAQAVTTKANEAISRVMATPAVQSVTSNLERSVSIANDFVNGMFDRSSPAPPGTISGVAGAVAGERLDKALDD
jgi:RHS repeat-associated protein